MAFGNASSAQDSIVVSSLQKDASTTTWHLLKQVNSVNIYYQYVECTPIEYINFKLENISSQTKNVSWTYAFYDNANSIQVNPDDVNVGISLNPNETIQGECFNGQNIKLQVYVREGNLSLRLNLVELINLTVTN